MTNYMIRAKKNLLNQNKKSGFTLVEVIVVIVIIAILAGIAVPALTGYIKRASERSIIAECRQAVIAAQTIADEMRATGGGALNGNPDATVMAEIIALSEIPASGVINHIIYTDSVVTELQYTNRGITVLYKNGKYTIVDGDGASTGSVNPPETFTFGQVVDKVPVGGVPTQENALAIKANAQEVVRIAESAMAEALAEHNGIYYIRPAYNNPMTRSINPNNMANNGAFEANIYDANGLVASNVSLTNFDTIFVNKITASGSNIGYTSLAFNVPVTVNGKTVYSNKVSSVTFKSNAMTGSTGNWDNYTYNVATGVLTHVESGKTF